MGLLRKETFKTSSKKLIALGILECNISSSASTDQQPGESKEDLLYLLRFDPTRADLLIRRMVREGRTSSLDPQVALLRKRFPLFSFLVTSVDYNERERRQIVRYFTIMDSLFPQQHLTSCPTVTRLGFQECLLKHWEETCEAATSFDQWLPTACAVGSLVEKDTNRQKSIRRVGINKTNVVAIVVAI